MTNIIKKQIKILERKESSFINKNENQFIKSKLTPIKNKIEDKIPDKLSYTLDAAFYKGFKLVFEKGTKYIEMTFRKGKIQLDHDLNNYNIKKSLSSQSIKDMDKQVNITNIKNAAISVVEGGALGLFGIGLPDVPLFIAVIMKSVYEIALSYGFDYESDKEKYYILLLICGAITKDEEQKEFNLQIEEFENNINEDIKFEVDLKHQIKITSNILSGTLLAAKFIQGITFVGVIGSAVNYSIIRKICKFAGLKYKKRYMYELLKKGASN